MSDFELILDECLAQLVSGASSLDEILARHPEHAAQLKPLLQTAAQFEAARSLQPSPAFKARARAQLTDSMQAHPRRRSSPVMPFWRVAVGLAVLALVFLMTGTAFAQSALPGQFLYAWKLSSERVWRAVAPNPMAVDLTLANRRVDEMVAVAGNSARESQALAGYLEALTRLMSESDAQNSVMILQALKSHQAKLSAAGISVPQLNSYISQINPVPNPANPSNTPAPILPNLAPTVLPKIIPTVKIPDLLP
jgi:hypothetical protein